MIKQEKTNGLVENLEGTDTPDRAAPNPATEDRRHRRTRQLLSRALIALSLEKGYEAVTIRDITNRANVGYATFFRHYRDKNELLKGVGEVVLEEIIDLLSPVDADGDPRLVGPTLFRYVADHSEIVRVLRGSQEIMKQVIATVEQRIVATHRAEPDSPVPLEIIAHHSITASISLVEWWLANRMPYPPEEMGRYYFELVIRPTKLMLRVKPGLL
jgi:AcrR family transcriptional regulator